MFSDDPPYLNVGDEVSAKFKGAFCEAKIKDVKYHLRCKMQMADSATTFVDLNSKRPDVAIDGKMKIPHPTTKKEMEAVVQGIKDFSEYHVIFNDGDSRKVKRSQLRVKGARHFDENESLDLAPLTHPEHDQRNKHVDSDADGDSGLSEQPIQGDQYGRVVSVNEDKEKKKWYPAMLISPKAQKGPRIRIRTRQECFVRSFKDGRCVVVPKSLVQEFGLNAAKKGPTPPGLKPAIEKVIAYLERDELPPHWNRNVLFGICDSGSEGSGSEADTDAPSEEKDRFVAHLYKFMEERGTPLNKVPMCAGKELNLYGVYRIVQKLGGYNKVCNKSLWKNVLANLELDATPTAIKKAYQKFLNSFENFNRKLGCRMWEIRSMKPRPGHRGSLDCTKSEEKSKKVTKRNEKDGGSTSARTEEESDDDEVSMKSGATGGSSTVDRGSKTHRSTPDNRPRQHSGSVAATAMERRNWESVEDDGGDLKVGQMVKVGYFKDFYQAKIQRIEQHRMNRTQFRYYVHYFGWNARYDEFCEKKQIIPVEPGDEDFEAQAAPASPRERQTSESSAKSREFSPIGTRRRMNSELRNAAPAAAAGTGAGPGRPPSSRRSVQRSPKSTPSYGIPAAAEELVLEEKLIINASVPKAENSTGRTNNSSSRADNFSVRSDNSTGRADSSTGRTDSSTGREDESDADRPKGRKLRRREPAQKVAAEPETDVKNTVEPVAPIIENLTTIENPTIVIESPAAVIENPAIIENPTFVNSAIIENSAIGNEDEISEDISSMSASPPYENENEEECGEILVNCSPTKPSPKPGVGRKRKHRLSRTYGPPPRRPNRTPKHQTEFDDFGEKFASSPSYPTQAAIRSRLLLEMEQNPNRPSKFSFNVIDPNLRGEKKIAVLQQRLGELRESYSQIKAELLVVERKRKKAFEKKKEQFIKQNEKKPTQIENSPKN